MSVKYDSRNGDPLPAEESLRVLCASNFGASREDREDSCSAAEIDADLGRTLGLINQLPNLLK